MAPRNLKALLALLLTSSAAAQTTETVWSSFAFILYGERTPLSGPGSGAGSLTTMGAQQQLSQGSLFRARYLTNGTLTEAQGNITTNAPIIGIERAAIDNSQLAIYTNTDDYLTGSALAFLQGLYPPVTSAFAYNNGGMSASVLANGSMVDYPLDGYQYPNIQSMSLEEPNSVWLEGHVACTEYYLATSNLRSDLAIDRAYNSSLQHYQDLWSTVFAGTFPMSEVNFDHAYELYDYASFQYNHNATVSAALSLDELNWIGQFASLQQFSQNGNLSVSGSQAGDMIRAISGRTLAGKVLAQFQGQITSRGSINKLTLMFGSFEPLLAFFSLSSLSYSHSSNLFQDIPPPGSAMVFELFSVDSDFTSYPTNEDLWVRFLYRNSTDPEEPLAEYPLFGRGYSESSMKYNDFVAAMNVFAIRDLYSWCNTCQSPILLCGALEDNASGWLGTPAGTVSKSYSLSPAVAGVIGAAMAIATIALAVTSAAVFGGLRIHRTGTEQKSSIGGFKGAEKMASDKDVSVVKGGVKHERVGSWELRGPDGPAAGTSKDETTFGATRMRNVDDDGDSVIMGRTPVKPLEGV